jgi:hypothetical protein
MSDSNEKATFEAIHRGDWDKAIEHAKRVPANYDIWQRLPSANNPNDGGEGMPNAAVHKVLDHLKTRPNQKDNLNSFLFEYAGHIPKHADAATLRRVGHEGREDQYVTNAIQTHPKFAPDEALANMKKVGNFWSSYERAVSPGHFATIKSHFTGQPETVTDHRGESANSHEAYLNPDGLMGHDKETLEHLKNTKFEYPNKFMQASDVLPHLDEYAKKVQAEIMQDKFTPKRYFHGEPHVKLYRGVGGHYGKAIKDAVGHNPETNEVDDKKIKLPTAHLTSWTTDPEMAARFAYNRGHIEGQPDNHGVVMSKWVPLKQVLHSGHHMTVQGQEHPHSHENEIVVGHPTASFNINSKNLKFQTKPQRDAKGNIHNYGEVADAKPKMTKNENKHLGSSLDSFLKEEGLLEKIEQKFAGIKFFKPLTQDDYSIVATQNINSLIRDEKIHDLSHYGHFTTDSFIVGDEPKDSWLLKLEPKNKPGVKSLKDTGPQFIKEACFYKLAHSVFGLVDYIPHSVMGEIQKDGKPHYAVAIKMLPDDYKIAQDLEKDDEHEFKALIGELTREGVVHKIATMFYILGEADSHGGNVMTNGKGLQMIDHGSSFANLAFDPSKDTDIFIPYILRVENDVKQNSNNETKFQGLPRIRNPKVAEELRDWILRLDPNLIKELMFKYKLDPSPELYRLEEIKELVKQSKYPDSLINSIWVWGIPAVKDAIKSKG